MEKFWECRDWSLQRWIQNHFLLKSDPGSFTVSSVDALSDILDNNSPMQEDKFTNSFLQHSLDFRGPFVRNELLQRYRRIVEKSTNRLVVVVGDHGVGKYRLLKECVTTFVKNPTFGVTYVMVTAKALECLTKIRAQEFLLHWISGKTTLAMEENLMKDLQASPWMAAVNKIVPVARGKTIVCVEDCYGYLDTTIALTGLLLNRGNITVTVSLSSQQNPADFGLEGRTVIRYVVSNYNHLKSAQLTREMQSVQFDTDTLHKISNHLAGNPLANAQVQGLSELFGDEPVVELLQQVEENVKAFKEYSARGSFPSKKTIRPTLASTKLLLDNMHRKDRVGDLAFRLLDILVVMQSSLVPVDKLYYIITCTDGMGFRDREPFADAITLLNALALVRIKSGLIQVYNCVRAHPAFRKAKDEMEQYVTSDPRVCFQFLNYVRHKLPPNSNEDAMSNCSDCPIDILIDDVEKEPMVRVRTESGVENCDWKGKGQRHPKMILKKDILIGIAMFLALFHSIFFTHIMRVGSLYTAFKDDPDSTVSAPQVQPEPVGTELFDVLPLSPPLDYNNPACISVHLSKFKGLQLELVSPINHDSLHAVLKNRSQVVASLFIDVDVLCSCKKTNNDLQLDAITLQKVEMLSVVNARKCDLQFWGFSLSLPNLKHFVFDNGNLIGKMYASFLVFLEPSLGKLKSITIDHSQVETSIVELLGRALNLELLYVNNKTVVAPS